MSRLDLAYLLLFLLIAVGATILHLSYRFMRYRHAIWRGYRHAKSVWHPFWM